MYDYLPSGECVASAFLTLPNKTRQTGIKPGSVPALSATRKLIEQPNNFLVTIFKKCKGSGLFYGPLAVRGSPSGRLGWVCLVRRRRGASEGSPCTSGAPSVSVAASHILVFVHGGAHVAHQAPLTPGPLPRKHGSELLLSTQSRGFVSRDFTVRPHTHFNVQVSNKK